MTIDRPAVVVILLVGPQASGKSTVAAALAVALRGQGEGVALVELDQIARMALPTLPSWDIAAHIFALVTGEWVASDVTCVIAEGISSREEVAVVLDRVPAGAAVVTVAMTTPFDAAWVRAQADLTREMSRDHDWLSDRYDEWSIELSRVNADVLLDAGSLPVDQGVLILIAAIESARSSSNRLSCENEEDSDHRQAEPGTLYGWS